MNDDVMAFLAGNRLLLFDKAKVKVDFTLEVLFKLERLASSLQFSSLRLNLIQSNNSKAETSQQVVEGI